jgi:hypothetical protein
MKHKVTILRQDFPVNSLVDAEFLKQITAYLNRDWKIVGVTSQGSIWSVMMVWEEKPRLHSQPPKEIMDAVGREAEIGEGRK